MLLNDVTQSIGRSASGFAAWLDGLAEIALCPIRGELFVPHGVTSASLGNPHCRLNYNNYNNRLTNDEIGNVPSASWRLFCRPHCAPFWFSATRSSAPARPVLPTRPTYAVLF